MLRLAEAASVESFQIYPSEGRGTIYNWTDIDGPAAPREGTKVQCTTHTQTMHNLCTAFSGICCRDWHCFATQLMLMGARGVTQ